MTERTIRMHAKELAGQFYDLVRSAESKGNKVNINRGDRAVLTIDPKVFGKTYPTVKDYLIGRRHGHVRRTADGMVHHVDDGSCHMDTPGWLHWYDMARQQLTSMLGMSTVHENIKQGIFKALIEDREKQQRLGTKGSPAIHQRRSLHGQG